MVLSRRLSTTIAPTIASIKLVVARIAAVVVVVVVAATSGITASTTPAVVVVSSAAPALESSSVTTACRSTRVTASIAEERTTWIHVIIF